MIEQRFCDMKDYIKYIFLSLNYIFIFLIIIGCSLVPEKQDESSLNQSSDLSSNEFIHFLQNAPEDNQDSIVTVIKQFFDTTISFEDKNDFMGKIENATNQLIAKRLNKPAKMLATKGLETAQYLKMKEFTIQNQLLLAEIYFIERKLDSADFFVNRAKENISGNDNSFDGAISHFRAKISEEKGNNEQAIEYYQQAINHFESRNMPSKLATVYDNLGTFHMELGNNKLALDYMLKAIQINEDINANDDLNRIYINLGIIYKEMDSLTQSRNWYLKSIALAKKQNHEYNLARAYMNLANVEKHAKNFNAAISYHDSSIQLCLKNKIDFGLMLNQISLGEMYLVTGEPGKALEQLQKTEKAVDAYKIPKVTEKFYRRLSEAYSVLDEFENAHLYLSRHIVLKDSIASVEMNKKIIELEAKYENEKKELAILQLEKNSLTQRLVISLLIVLGLFIFILFQRIRLRHKIVKKDILISQQKTDILQTKMTCKNNELNGLAIQLIEMQNQLEELSQHITSLIDRNVEKENPVVKEIIRYLKKYRIKSSVTKQFQSRLADANQQLYSNLLNKYPELTPTELKICALLRMNLSSKEIANLTNRSIRTIDFTRNNIRKKMNLDANENLQIFLMQF